MCAAWDSMPGMPWSSSCPDDVDFSKKEFNWCQVPWCYVDSSCSSGYPTDIFNGSDIAYYSYEACGDMPNCYDEFDEDERCPFDPYGDHKYKVFKDDCKCTHHGFTLPVELYTKYPDDEQGKYEDLKNIEYYGTTCASWDSSPEMPFADFCPAGADWCSTSYNWCQAPWCYVDAGCGTGRPSSVFKGSPSAHYSYDTCMSTPNCYDSDNGVYHAECPFGCEQWTIQANTTAQPEGSCMEMSGDDHQRALSRGFVPRGCH